MKHHLPFIFNHEYGTLKVFAPSPRAAIKKAKKIANGMHVVPAFQTKPAAVFVA